MKKNIIPFLAAAMLLAASCGNSITVPETVSIIPEPMEMTVGEDAFDVAGATFWIETGIDSRSRKHIEAFAERLSLVTGKKSKIVNVTGRSFVFIQRAEIPKEGYELRITPLAACISASSVEGFMYAIQTICQMLPVEVYGTAKAPKANWALRSVTIKDQPRFAYRGMLLDCARHYFSVDQIKKCIDVMAIHKMNRLHWHLTEDQGWRIEIKKYPKLSEIGSVRHGTMIGKDWGSNDGIEKCRRYLDTKMDDIGRPVYGVTTGFGSLCNVTIPADKLSQLHTSRKGQSSFLYIQGCNHL